MDKVPKCFQLRNYTVNPRISTTTAPTSLSAPLSQISAPSSFPKYEISAPGANSRIYGVQFEEPFYVLVTNVFCKEWVSTAQVAANTSVKSILFPS